MKLSLARSHTSAARPPKGRWARLGTTSVLGVMVLAAALLACKKSGPKEVKASCDMRSSAGSGSSICMDFHTEPNDKVRAICSPAAGYTMAARACDTSAALGGCQRGNTTTWYYPSSKHASSAAAKAECPSDFVTPGGK
ncbi:MAG: hypothetical protein U0263_17880 [Polyangiaceae bacterium]